MSDHPGDPANWRVARFVGELEAIRKYLKIERWHTSVICAVEFQWSDRKLNPFSVIAQANHLTFYLRRPLLNANDGLFESATAQFGAVKPNALGEYRTDAFLYVL